MTHHCAMTHHCEPETFSIHTMKSITHAKEEIHSVFYTLLSVYILFNQLLQETCLLSHFSLVFLCLSSSFFFAIFLSAVYGGKDLMNGLEVMLKV